MTNKGVIYINRKFVVIGIILIIVIILIFAKTSFFTTSDLEKDLYTTNKKTIIEEERDILLEIEITHPPGFFPTNFVIFHNLTVYYCIWDFQGIDKILDYKNVTITTPANLTIKIMNKILEKNIVIDDIDKFFNIYDWVKNFTKEQDLIILIRDFFTNKISIKTKDQLIKISEKYNFFEMNDLYCKKRDGTIQYDFVSYTDFIYSYNGKTKKVTEYGADGMDSLHQLQSEIKKSIREDLNLNENYKIFYSKSVGPP